MMNANKIILSTLTAVLVGICPAATTYNLANGNVTVPANTTATITQSNNGTATSNWISIGSGATVTLTGINIKGDYIEMGRYQYVSVGAGSTIILNGVKIETTNSQVSALEGSGVLTIVIADGSSNSLKSCSTYNSTIHGNGTLTLKGGTSGTGKLTVASNISGGCGAIYSSGKIIIEGGSITATTAGSSNGCPAIGASYDGNHDSVVKCGGITIKGGNVTATSSNGPGLGGYCGDVIISGGTVVSTGRSAGIGDGCTSITIADTVEKVVATKSSSGSNYIGGGGTVSIGSRLQKSYSNNNLTLTLTPTYSITWKNYNGETLKTDTGILRGTTPSYTGPTPIKPSTAQYSYTFKGWSPTIVSATADTTYTATYTANLRSYAVTWKNDDGSTLKSESVSYGMTPDYGGVPENQSTDGNTYAFAGWIPEVVPVTEAATYTATYVKLNPEEPVISPDSGTTFDSSLTVSMSCPTEGATIYYTTNGVDPTVESAVYKRFRIYGKTTVKAIAEKDGMLSDVVTAEYALGRCVDPRFSLADGATFAHSNQVVSIRWNNDGILRYTLDGSEPTAESPVYDGPFTFNDSVVIKAKVFSDDFFDSAVVTASLTREWENVATPVIDAAESFTGSKTKVVISCATDDAIVRYTLNGNEPNSHSTKYTGPFYVTDSCTVKAYAVKIDYLNSAVATHAIEKVWGIGDSLGKPDHGFATEGDGGAGWTRVEDTTAPNGEAMKSGAISDNQTSTLSTTVVGPGTLSFSWRTSCEEDALHEWDHAEFAVDGNVRLYRDGVNSWQQESVRIEGGGEHTVTWVYKKDDVESEGDDAAWVAGYGWVSDLTETQTTDVHVPYAWLLGHDPEIVDEYDAYEAAAKVTGANGHKVWESYVIGADPNDKDDSLKITAFPMKADGTPDFEAITISPPQLKWNVEGAQPVLKGKATLDGAGEWQPVKDENKADMRFFRVEAVLP